jgi:hypothetical protein
LAADFVIKELLTSDGFLDQIKDFFYNHREIEDARKALQSLLQGNKNTAKCNVHVNTLLYTVELSEISKCEVYEAAINPKIVELGIHQGGWSELTNLVDKQAMAVKLAVDVNHVSLFNNQQRTVAPPTRIEYCTPPAAQTTSKRGPMDIDSILADGFSFQAWRKECTDREMCICCPKPSD